MKLKPLVASLSGSFFLVVPASVWAAACYPTVTIEIVRPSGGGSSTGATDSPVSGKPDFIVNRNWLETVGGVEQYVYSKTDEIKMKAQLKNTGSASIPGSSYIETRFYLSKGYKEDAHSDWIRVGTDQTLGNNLDPGETHTETEGLKLWEYSEVKPGKRYNIVSCVDRIADQNNESGAWAEKHESNNCSTEAIFTVNGSFDFRITSVALGSGKTSLLPGEVFSVDTVAYNAGDSAPSDTRVGYYISGGELLNRVLLGTDNIKEVNFASGISKPETLSYAVAPMKPATYTLEACTDYDNRVNEANEANNCASFVFAVVNPNPPVPPAPPVVRHLNPALYHLLFD